MVPIADREVRGLTARQIGYWLVSLVSICGTIIYSFNNLTTQVANGQIKTEILQVQLETMKIEQKTVNSNIQAFDIRLTKLEAQADFRQQNRQP